MKDDAYFQFPLCLLALPPSAGTWADRLSIIVGYAIIDHAIKQRLVLLSVSQALSPLMAGHHKDVEDGNVHQAAVVGKCLRVQYHRATCRALIGDRFPSNGNAFVAGDNCRGVFTPAMRKREGHATDADPRPAVVAQLLQKRGFSGV